MIGKMKHVHLRSSYKNKRYKNLPCRNSWSDIAMISLCLVLRVQTLISFQLKSVCYPYLLTDKILNLLLSKEWPNPDVVMLNYLIWWFFAEEERILFPSWKHTKFQGPKAFLRTKGPITPTNNKTQNITHVTLFTVNFVAVNLWKQNTMTLLIS